MCHQVPALYVITCSGCELARFGPEKHLDALPTVEYLLP